MLGSFSVVLPRTLPWSVCSFLQLLVSCTPPLFGGTSGVSGRLGPSNLSQPLHFTPRVCPLPLQPSMAAEQTTAPTGYDDRAFDNKMQAL